MRTIRERENEEEGEKRRERENERVRMRKGEREREIKLQTKRPLFEGIQTKSRIRPLCIFTGTCVKNIELYYLSIINNASLIRHFENATKCSWMFKNVFCLSYIKHL